MEIVSRTEIMDICSSEEIFRCLDRIIITRNIEQLLVLGNPEKVHMGYSLYVTQLHIQTKTQGNKWKVCESGALTNFSVLRRVLFRSIAIPLPVSVSEPHPPMALPWYQERRTQPDATETLTNSSSTPDNWIQTNLKGRIVPQQSIQITNEKQIWVRLFDKWRGPHASHHH